MTTTETSLRTIDLRAAGLAPRPRRACDVAGCPRLTSHGKPFCLAHIDRLSYVRRIRSELARKAPPIRLYALRRAV